MFYGLSEINTWEKWTTIQFEPFGEMTNNNIILLIYSTSDKDKKTEMKTLLDEQRK